jgi:tRNA pseudouridine55 synthase
VITAFLVVDKPPGLTSHDIVAAVRACTGVAKVGHTGTLDPFATGVLPLALGGATRLIQYLDESIKVYDATIRLGAATDTGDPTGKVVREAPVPDLDEGRVRSVLASFVGKRMQRPPAYSAVKLEGRPLYSYARKGETPEVAPRPITLHAVDLVALSPPFLRVSITCSRGTYARVLADEIAVALGTAGHLDALVRPRSGPFLLDDALSMDQLGRLVTADPSRTWNETLLGRSRTERVPWRPRSDVMASLQPWLRSAVQCLPHLPIADVGPVDARRIRSGGPAPLAPAAVPPQGRYLVMCGADVVAIAERDARGPKVVKVIEADA